MSMPELGSLRDRADQVRPHGGRHPHALGQPAAGPPGRPAAAAQPGHDGARRAGRPHADLPDGDDRPGGLARSPRSRSRSAVRDVYRLWRPTPLFRAHRLERELDTPAHIYYKYEGVSPAGSHKPNTRGRRRRTTTAEAGVQAARRPRPAPASGARRSRSPARLFGLECVVFMVGASYDQKPYRRSMMETLGRDGASARRATPTEAGKRQAAHPTGSLGIAISEAVEVAAAGRGHELRARLGAEPRAACTRP